MSSLPHPYLGDMLKRLALISMMCAAWSCSEAKKPGSIEVAWRIGRLTCDEAGVSTVSVELHDFDEVRASSAKSCTQTSTRLDEVKAGDYALLMRGLDVDGCWTHEARRDDVAIPAGDVLDLGELVLLRRKRPLLVRWPFENEYDCAANEVEQVQVTIDVDDDFSRTEVFLCPGLAHEIPDVPRGALRVTVIALDADGTAIAWGAVEYASSRFLENPCSNVVEARVPVEICREANCGFN